MTNPTNPLLAALERIANNDVPRGSDGRDAPPVPYAIQRYAREALSSAPAVGEAAWADLLTKAVGDITAALTMAGKQDKLKAWTAPYIEALNQFDAHPIAPAVGETPFVWMLRHKATGEPYWNENQCVWDNRYDADERADHEPEYEAVPLYAHPIAAAAGEGAWCFDMEKMHGVNEVAFDTGFGSAYIRVCEQVIVEPTLVDGFPVPRDQWKYGYRYDEKLTDTTGRAYAWRSVPVPPVTSAGKIAHPTPAAGEGEVERIAKAMAPNAWLDFDPKLHGSPVNQEATKRRWLQHAANALAALSQPAGDARREALEWYRDQMCEGFCEGFTPRICKAAMEENPTGGDCAGCRAVVALASTKSPDADGGVNG